MDRLGSLGKYGKVGKVGKEGRGGDLGGISIITSYIVKVRFLFDFCPFLFGLQKKGTGKLIPIPLIEKMFFPILCWFLSKFIKSAKT